MVISNINTVVNWVKGIQTLCYPCNTALNLKLPMTTKKNLKIDLVKGSFILEKEYIKQKRGSETVIVMATSFVRSVFVTVCVCVCVCAYTH